MYFCGGVSIVYFCVNIHELLKVDVLEGKGMI